MKAIKVKDMMVPLEEYATVNDEATFKEALHALVKAQKDFDASRYRHRAVLVLDKENHVVGKVSIFDTIRAIEPKYEQIQDSRSPSRSGYSSDFLKSMMNEYFLWDQSFETLLERAGKMKVKNFMYIPSEGEYIDEDAPLGEGIHALVMGHHHSLLVTKRGKITGVLRVTDIFEKICREI